MQSSKNNDDDITTLLSHIPKFLFSAAFALMVGMVSYYIITKPCLRVHKNENDNVLHVQLLEKEECMLHR